MEGADFAQDFVSLLLGQLAAVRPLDGQIPGAPAKAAGDSTDRSDEEDAASGDPLALLAALAQAPVEPRGQAVPAGEAPPASAGAADREPLAGERLLDAGRVAQDAPAATGRPPANETAAKFAALPDAMSGKSASASPEPVAPPAVGAAVAPGVPVRHDDAPATVSLPISTSIYDRRWNDDFAQKVVWIATQHGQSAELTLNPPAMGSIEVSLKLDHGASTAVATFVSSNAEVRETIETALPRLREMLAGIGIELGQAQVGAESFRQASGDGQNPGEGASPSGNELAILTPDAPAARRAVLAIGAGRGLVDMFV
jgi:flagellar hook-length control protein FliK